MTSDEPEPPGLDLEVGELIHFAIPGEPDRYLIVTDVEETTPNSATISVVTDPFTDESS